MERDEVISFLVAGYWCVECLEKSHLISLQMYVSGCQIFKQVLQLFDLHNMHRK